VTVPAAPPRTCRRCATELGPTLLRCPACGTLVHAERLTALAREAESVAGYEESLRLWNEALLLLPPDAPQREGVLTRIRRLESVLHGDGAAKAKAPGGRGLGVALGASAVFLLTKGKFLLLGLTKASTLLSMVAFAGVYWTNFGWAFALGLVASIYVHEMGHVAALKRYGIPASAPMFIPGLGALVRLKAHPPTPAQDARVGLAGPIWGTGAALATYLLYLGTGHGIFAGITHVGAVLNLFNLIPVWQLDGGRGIASQNRMERSLLFTGALAAFAVTHEGMLLLIALAMGFQLFREAPAEGDRGAFLQFLGLLVALSALGMVRQA
jgi:Zn-dependent protease